MTGPYLSEAAPQAPLRVRVASRTDVPQVVALLTEAATWARDRGVARWWPIPFPEAWVETGVQQGGTWVLELGGALVGTFELRSEDPRMWGPQPPVAGYVHRLAVKRSFAGRGFGRYLLDRAESEVRGWGRSKLRLDCLATNDGLVAYYRAQGFREVGRVSGVFPGEDRASVLFERAVGPRPGAEPPGPSSSGRLRTPR
jgi:ribosomal protein S18 acetylase RimI-like enzyme